MPEGTLIVKNWELGVADSPHLGIGVMRNADIESYPGALKVQRKTVTIFHTAYSGTFTADAGTDICTTTPATFSNSTGLAVTFSSSGTLPAPLVAGTVYFVIGLSASTFKVATTLANANASTAINITDAGTGTHTVVTVNPGTIKSIVNDPRTSTKFLQDSNGRVWWYGGGLTYLLTGNTLTNSSGNGLAVFRTSDGLATYLFVYRNARVDVINVFGTSNKETPVWTNDWQTLNTGAGFANPHYAIVGQDNIIYYVDDRYIGSIKELTIFDPANGATFTWSQQALDVPQGEVLYWLEELGVNLLAAGVSYDKIYPWDRVSDSYGLPLPVPERGVYRLKNIGNMVYILAGTKGNIYRTQGTYVTFFKRLPQGMGNVALALPYAVTWGGIGARDGALLFGAAGNTAANSGVYILYPTGVLAMDNTPSTGAGNATALYADSDSYYLGYASGADTIDTNRYASFETVVQSELYRVATDTGKAKYSKLEIQSARAGTSPFGNVRISWRPDLTSSFTTLATFQFTSGITDPGQSTDIGLTDLENIQIQVEMDGMPELLEVRLFP